MAKIKLTKTELKAQSDALKRFLRFLPMLQLKKQQLQAEIAGIMAKAESVSAEERSLRRSIDSWVGLFASGEEIVAGLVSVKAVRTSQANIEGVAIPVFDGIDADVRPIDLWETPAWIDDAVDAVTRVLALQAERVVLEEQKRLVSEELRTTSQRVNLFETVTIPECRENIRVIKIAIGDEQTAAVTRGKMAKARGKGDAA